MSRPVRHKDVKELADKLYDKQVKDLGIRLTALEARVDTLQEILSALLKGSKFQLREISDASESSGPKTD